jgi:hypothetical protein
LKGDFITGEAKVKNLRSPQVLLNRNFHAQKSFFSQSVNNTALADNSSFTQGASTKLRLSPSLISVDPVFYLSLGGPGGLTMTPQSQRARPLFGIVVARGTNDHPSEERWATCGWGVTS